MRRSIRARGMADTPAVANLAIEPPSTAIAETVGTARDYVQTFVRELSETTGAAMYGE